MYNYVERIIDPLQSRCQVLKVVPPSKKEVAYHLSWIMDLEKIAFNMDDLGSIVLQFYPDLRKCINTIQANTVNGELKLDKSVLFSSNYIDEVIDELCKSKSNFKNIRQIIANANTDDYEDLFRTLYDKFLVKEIYSNFLSNSTNILTSTKLYSINLSTNTFFIILLLLHQNFLYCIRMVQNKG